MNIQWIVNEDDKQRILEFVKQYENRSFVENRIKRNVNGPLPEYSREIFWKALMVCLLTTRQPSGPDSKVNKFLYAEPFQLSYIKCTENQENIEEFIVNKLREHKIWMSGKIAKFTAINLNWLESGGWNLIDSFATGLSSQRIRDSRDDDWILERRIAEETRDVFIGIGPKQSRNLWQVLGLTRYEIPIDSRVTEWLNDQKFPFHVSSRALTDSDYYNLVLDGIREICRSCGILPCKLDACVFSRKDKQEWPQQLLKI